MAATRRGEEASTSTSSRWHYPVGSRTTPNLARKRGDYFAELSPKFSRSFALERFRDCRNVLGSVSATAAGNVDQSAVCNLRQITRHVWRPEIEACFRKRIRQTSIGVSRD